jgi:hypothetical protein
MKHAAILLVLLLGGCVPAMSQYARYDVPGAMCLHGSCVGSAGAPTLVYFPFHEIHISLYLLTLLMGVHIPDGVTVQLDDTAVAIAGATENGSYAATFQLAAARHQAIFPRTPREFASHADPYASSTDFGPLIGAGQGDNLAWYLFLAADPQDPHLLVRGPKLIKGTIRLPAMTINGKRYEAEDVSFALDTFAGIASLNC